MTSLAWEYSGATRTAPVNHPASLYVAALGADRAATLFLKRGGSEIYCSANPRLNTPSDLVRIIGIYGVKALNLAFSDGYAGRVPLATEFLVRHFRSRGMSVTTIARTVRRTDSTVRKILAKGKIVRAGA